MQLHAIQVKQIQSGSSPSVLNFRNRLPILTKGQNEI